MKKVLLVLILLVNGSNQIHAQGSKFKDDLKDAGIAALTYVAAKAELKDMAKEISQFRSKEYIVNHLIKSEFPDETRFETDALASDNSAGLISIAFNCDQQNKRGLLLAFFGNNRNQNGEQTRAYGFKYIPLSDARKLLKRLEEVKAISKKYLSGEADVNNVFIAYQDMKFIIYQDNGIKIRTLWNGFEVIWERVAFERTKKRLEKWFN